MKYKLTDSVHYKDNGKTIKGDILDIRGDNYVIHNGISESIVSEQDILVISDDETFNNGGDLIVSDKRDDLNYVNSKEFYRHYPINSEPFKISHDQNNKYGFGIYFTDNSEFYGDKFDNARIVTIKPKLQHPLILTYHKRMTPSFEYSELVKNLIDKGEIKDSNELNNNLVKSGFDSLVIYEPRGIYLILLKKDESLYEIISDLGIVESKTRESYNSYENHISNEISKFISNKQIDILPYELEILYRNFNDGLDSFFIPSIKDSEYIANLVSNSYIIRDYEIVGEAYVLTEKGKGLTNDLILHLD